MWTKNLKIVVLCALFAMVSCAKQNPIVSGTFEGTGEGRNGDIVVSVELVDSVITGITVVSSEETESMVEPVYTDMLQTMINNNNINVDSISGATISAEGFVNAVDNALEKAGVNLKGKKISPTKIVKLDPIQNYDIVVVGSGGAGLSAAIEAKNNGAEKVVVLEKMSAVGGNTLRSGGAFNAAETWIQDKLNITDTKNSFYEDTLAGGDNLGDPELVKYLSENATDSVNWLKEYIGVKFVEETLQHLGGHSTARAVIPAKNSGASIINPMKAKAEELGIVIITSIKAESLAMSDDRVTGVITKNQANEEIIFNASKAVILATGGFSANVEMRTKYDKAYGDSYLITGAPALTGDGIVMAEKIGASLVDMKEIQVHPTTHPDTGALSVLAGVRFYGGIIVNQQGNRIVEELDRRDVISKAISAQDGGYAYLLWNKAIGEAGGVQQTQQAEFNMLKNKGFLFEENSIEALAQDANIPVENLVATMAKVNEYAKNKKDLDFNHRNGLVEMTEGPYYIQKIVPAVHYTMGGLKINTNAQVINNSDQIIKGLYAAGEVTGGIHGSNRLGGNSIADIIVFGRTAGKNAAQGI